MSDEPHSLVVPASGVVGLLRALPVTAALAAAGRAVGVTATGPETALLALAPGAVLAVDPTADSDATWDDAYVLRRGFAAAFLVRALGVRRRVGVRGILRRPFLTETVATDAPEAFLAAAGVAPSPPPWLVPTPELRERARDRLARAHLTDRGTALLAVAPAAPARGPAWPRRRWVALLQHLRRHRPTLRFLLLTTTEDLWSTVRIHEETGRLHPVLGPDLDLPTTATLLTEVDLLLTTATLPTELATAVGTPILRPAASDEDTAAAVDQVLVERG